MKFHLDTRGAHLTAAVTLLVFTALALLPLESLGSGWMRLAAGAGIAALVWGYTLLYTHYAHWQVRSGTFFCRTGLLFTAERHIPLRLVSSIHTVTTPLGRPLGMCLMVVQAPGALAVLPYVRTVDAAALEEYWRHFRSLAAEEAAAEAAARAPKGAERKKGRSSRH